MTAARIIDPGMLAEAADALKEEYLETLRHGIDGNPRSAQRRIGPSEIGIDCMRALAHKLNKDVEPPRAAAWKPAVGTALHTQVEEWFQAVARTEEQHGRWLTEQRVTVGTIGGEEITGSTDLWDEWSHAVIDHKFVGATALRDYRTNGPSRQYRVQGHLYGKGWENAGKHPDIVMIAFVPRDGELEDTYFWWEQYQPAVAEDALRRANDLFNSIQALGMETVLASYLPCTEIPALKKKSAFCPWCSTNGPRRTYAPRIPKFTPHNP
jgi:hypothetical protein